MKLRRRQLDDNGIVLVAVLGFIVVILILSGALLTMINTNFSTVNNNVKSQQAFNIAEAGINYYLWHLSHNGTDYQDGNTGGTPDPNLGYGPYTHNYVDSDAKSKGTFKLYIKPQGGGSTIVTVRSIGQVNSDNNIRTIVAQIGAASFASYGVVSDSSLWFGANETASGPVHSNQGIRLDGPNTDAATSANTTYVPSGSIGGDGNSHPGVWCNSSVISPVNCNTRNKTTWQYPVPSVNFASVTSSLCTMKKVALADNASTASLANQTNACSTALPTTRTSSYLPQICTTGSGSSCSYSATRGYLIKLNPNGTYDLLRVNSENDRLRPYTSALGTTTLGTGISLPPSGVIYAEDNVWILSNPTFHGRVSVAAGRLAQSTINAEVVLAGPLAYTSKTAGDAIGIVSESSIFMAPYAPFAIPGVTWPSNAAFNFEIDGALLAQSNNVTYGENTESDSNTFGFRSSPSSSPRYTYGWTNSNQTLTMYGSVAVRQTWTWNIDYGSGNSNCPSNSPNLAFDAASGHCFSGIMNTVNQYDYDLLYAPPPSYPLANGYQILSWREVLTRP